MKKNEKCIPKVRSVFELLFVLRLTVVLTILMTMSVFANSSGKTLKVYPVEQKTSIENKVITGKVTDESGVPLPGVSVVVKDSGIGTTTDFDGNYSLEIPVNAKFLLFSYTGMKPVEIEIAGKMIVNVVMKEDAVGLQEVVVVGYGSMSKSNITGSITSVKADDLPRTAATSVDQMLQGRVPGLTLNINSAQPGGSVDVNLRGSISPRGNNSPLYVIDGVPITNSSSSEPGLMDKDLGFNGGVDRSPLNSINPSDIESVDVLKDASAAAIYGSAAANGVILITTKKGKQGSLSVDYRGSLTLQDPKEYLDYLNAENFMKQHNRMAYDKYLFDNKLSDYGNTDPSSVPSFTPRFSDSEISQAGEGTNWIGMFIRNGHVMDHNISINSGGEKTRLYASANFYDNEAILQNSDFKRYNGRINFDQKISDKIDLGVKSTFSQINSNNASTGGNSGGVEKFNMLQAAYAFAPNIGIYEEDGSFTRTYDGLITNPAAFLIIKDKLRTNRFFITPKLDIKLTDELKLTGIVSMDRNTSTRNFYLPAAAENAQLPDGMAQLSTNRIDNYTGESYLSYTKEFDNSTLSAVAGFGVYKSINDGFGMQAVGFFTDAFQDHNVSVSSNLLKNIQNSYRDERTKVSQFFRVNYSLYDRYIFNFVGRRDGSSIFAENKKYGFFPGASVAWRLNKESFLKDVDHLSDLKLRIGYGASGNESILSGNSFQLYRPGLRYGFGEGIYTGVVLAQVENKDLTWETDISINLGIDFGFFDNRIAGSIDLFQKTANDLLDFNLLPSNNAVGRVAANVGSTRSQGLELALNTINVQSNNFKWESYFTFSTYKATWVERNPEVAFADYIDEKGGISDIYGWETDGIIKSVQDIPSYMPNAFLGNVKYVDQNNDGVLNIDDVVKINNWNPDFSFGIGNTVTYKNFDLNFYVYGNIGQPAYYGYAPNSLGIAGSSPLNTLTTIKDVWSIDNPSGNLPGIASNPYSSFNPTGIDDFNLLDASFARIKNISLGYKLPSLKFLNGTFKNVRLFVDFQNVALISNYKGFDPEYSSINPYPQAFSSTFGIDLSF